DDLTAETLTDAAVFLTGRCSCQVKRLNPGVDLLVSADWDSIFAEKPSETARPRPLDPGGHRGEPTDRVFEGERVARVRRPLEPGGHRGDRTDRVFEGERVARVRRPLETEVPLVALPDEVPPAQEPAATATPAGEPPRILLLTLLGTGVGVLLAVVFMTV